MIGKRKAFSINLLSLLAYLDVDVHPEGEDKILWSLDSRGIFSANSLHEKMLESNRPNFPTKAVLKSRAPTKVCFLAWAVYKGKIPTEAMLKKETSIQLVDVQCALNRKSWPTASLSIIIGSLHFCFWLFPSFG